MNADEQKGNIVLYFERLRRHYDHAVLTYDRISFWELSHSLRMWTELKTPLEQHFPKFSTALSFKTALPTPKVLKTIRNHKFVVSYMPKGVKTYASNGEIVAGPNIEGDFTIAAAIKRMPDHVLLDQFCTVEGAFGDGFPKELMKSDQKRLTYKQWLGAEVVRLSMPSKNGALEVVKVDRETIIKRVANTMDGSHPSSAADPQQGHGNKFDEPVKHLMSFKMGNAPLPYFILLKIAQDILEVAPKLMEAEKATAGAVA